MDSLSGNAEVSAIVQFYKGDDANKPIAYTTTSENGTFSHTLAEKGKYRLYLHNLGKKDKSVEFIIGEQTEIDLGTVFVQDDAATLKAGSVTALSKLVAIDADKITYKVENDIEAKTKSILDILRKIPLVSVDATGKISINGNSSFLVYMDGIKNQMMSDNPTEVFRAMPASMVQNIEVITDPGARYDAEGVGAVLSIKSIARGMKDKGKDFYNGNVSLGGSFRRINEGVYFSAIKNKWTVSLNLSNINTWENNVGLSRERLSTTSDGSMKTTSSGKSDLNSYNIFGNLSASYEIDKYNFLSVSAGIMDIYAKEKKHLATGIDLSSQIFEYDEYKYSNMRLDMFNANIDYQHLWKNKPGTLFVLSYQISGMPTKNFSESTYTPVSNILAGLNNRKDDGYTNSTTHTAQADFQTRLAKNHNLSAGAKVTMRHNLSDYNTMLFVEDAYMNDDSGDLRYDFYNNIGALFAEYSGRFKSFKLRAGVRYEHTWQKIQYNKLASKDFKLNYGNLVPSGSFQYDINDSQNIGLTYTMTISRPGITYLNPYVDQSDPSSMTYGNPDLKPVNGHRIGLSYNYFKNKWMVSMRLGQSFMNKGISSYMFYDDDNILNTTYGNIVNSSTTSLNTYVSWKPGQKTNIIVNGQAGYNIFNSSQLGLSAKGFTYDLMTSVEQIIPADIVLNASVMYLANSLSLQSRTSGIWEASLSISRSFLKDKLNLSLRGATHIGIHYGALMSTTYHGDGFTAKDDMILPWRDLFVNLSYTFGNKDYISVKKSKKKKISDDQMNMDSNSKSF